MPRIVDFSAAAFTFLVYVYHKYSTTGTITQELLNCWNLCQRSRVYSDVVQRSLVEYFTLRL